MARPVPASDSGHPSVPLYRRPSRLRRVGALLLTAGGALAVACGGSEKQADDPGQVSVGIETDRGLWVNALVAAGYQVYAINPKAAARYRDRHHVGASLS